MIGAFIVAVYKNWLLLPSLSKGANKFGKTPSMA